MKRPLFSVCLLLVLIYSVLIFSKIISTYSQKNISLPENSTTITFSGRVSNKNGGLIYVNHIDIFPSSKITLIFESENIEIPKIGEKIILTGKFRHFESATNPGQFDSKNYYYSKNIYGKLTNVSILFRGAKYNYVLEGLFRLRETLKKHIYSLYSDKEASILCDLLLGDKSEIEADIKSLYQRNGISHILSISGLHISIIGMGLYSLLKKIRIPIKVSAFISMSFMIFYCLLTGMSISAVRAVTMFLLRLLGEMLGRTYDSLTSTALAGIALIIISPSNISSTSYLLSFSAIMGITCLSPAILRLVKDYYVLNIKRPELYIAPSRFPFIKEKIKLCLSYFGSMFISSLSITLTTLPISLYYFYEVPVYGVFLNLIILPFMGLLLILGLLSMATGSLLPVNLLVSFILSFYEAVLRIGDKLPFNTWNPGRPKTWQIICYYLVWLLIILYKKYRDVIFIKAGRLAFMTKLPVTIISLCLMVYIMQIPRLHNTTLIFLDVGQGDAIIMHTTSGETFLFDGGSSSKPSVGKNIIKPALKYYGLSRIDSLFISHPDSDHCNGAIEILENSELWRIKVCRIVLPDCNLPDDNSNMKKLLSYKNKLCYVSAGSRVQTKSLEMTCLSPQKNSCLPDMNESSEVFYVSLHNFHNLHVPAILLTGDIENEAELSMSKKLDELNSSNSPLILKVAHHGSRYSTSSSFLNTAKPIYSIISVGKDNKYSHPHAETLERLSNAGSKSLRTDVCGSIILSYKRSFLEISTHKTGKNHLSIPYI